MITIGSSPESFQWHETVGQNRDEKVLSPSVNFATSFGKLAQKFNLGSPDEAIYAQPLWLVTNINGNTRRLVIVATEANSIYAFDSGAQHYSCQVPEIWQIDH